VHEANAVLGSARGDLGGHVEYTENELLPDSAAAGQGDVEVDDEVDDD
jgi:hypothetical protein